MPSRVAAGKQAGLEAWTDRIETEIHAEIGTYQSGDAGFEDWAPLSAATLEGWDGIGGRVPGKIERGLASAGNDNPLRATGAMAASFETAVDGDTAGVGTADIVAVYQNDGTDERGVPYAKGEKTAPGIQAREFIGRSAFRTSPDGARELGGAIVKAMIAP